MSCIFKSSKSDNNRETRIYFSNDGEYKYESKYENGKLHGVSATFNRVGELISKTEYRNGLLHGSMIKFFSDGEVMYKCQYLIGEKHGEEVFYYENRIIKRINIYEYGNKVSTKRYNEDGTYIH